MPKKKKAPPAKRPTLATVAARLERIETAIRLQADHLQGLIGLAGELHMKIETVQTQVHDVLRVRIPEEEATTDDDKNLTRTGDAGISDR